MPGVRMPTSLDVRVQQAIAMQRSLDWMRCHLGVEPRYVDEVLAQLDAINRSPDCEPAAKPYRKTGAKR
jgi:hypothetical protein